MDHLSADRIHGYFLRAPKSHLAYEQARKARQTKNIIFLEEINL